MNKYPYFRLVCNQSFVDGDRSPGLVDWTSVKGKCVVNDTMKIVWDDPNGKCMIYPPKI